MADVPNGEQGCGSPLELFKNIAAQGELVRALKARNAAKVSAGKHSSRPPRLSPFPAPRNNDFRFF
uniref:Uncharacterized protein n=1 Tax=Balaenoptera musculus TaxID=9771 RepID=A0A8C0HV01_BALMU